MTSRFISVSEARVVSGIDSTLISDSDMSDLIVDIEYQIEKFLNCHLIPHVEIDSLDGNSKLTIFTKKAPLLNVRKLQVNDTDISISSVDFKKSGLIRLLTNADQRSFTNLRKTVFIKYVHGRVEWDKLTETTTTSALSIGTSVDIAISSEIGFQVGDWVEINSFDGNIEHSKITAITTNQITVDELVFDHVTDAIVRKMFISPVILRLIKIWVAIAAITRAVGQSFDEITGYTMGEFQVQKGEPFTQFRESIVRLESQAQDIQSRLRPTPGIII